MNKIIILVLLFAISFTSCNKDDDKVERESTTMSGQIINSQTGDGLANATLSFYDSNKKSTNATPVFTLVTDASGYYNGDAYVGTFTAIITAENYYEMTVIFTISQNSNQNNFEPITSVQELSTNEVLRVVLTWGASPYDLDSHLTGPLTAVSDRFHMYYGDKTPSGSNVNLDVDDTQSYGPETTTIYNYVDGVYRYSVHNYSKSEIDGAIEIFNSPAIVSVYNNNGLIKSYTAPTTTSTSGDTWTVFEIEVNGGSPSINDINTYYFADYDDGVTK